ncbi:hypothetical protein CL645_02710 [bacterium]|nr:hypothetical protein [bacterium]
MILAFFLSLILNPIFIENQFIKIRVNPGPQEEARFALDTTQGNPEEPNDNEKKLIYGAKMPWSSFAIIKIDEKTFIFGGASRNDRKNFFTNLQTGNKISEPYIEDEKIISTWEFSGVEISQILSFEKGYSTNLKDAMGITYIAKSTDQKEHKVAITLILDTMLGENDGAPLRAEGAQGLIESEICFEKSELPEFWQAWDTEDQATIKAEGRLKIKDKQNPKRLVLANWGKLAKTNWNIECQPGASFVRDGDFEDEKDTAVAIVWDSITVGSKPQEFHTTYGIADAPAPPECKPLSAYISGKPFEIASNEEKSFFGNWTTDKDYPIQPKEATLTVYSNDGLKIINPEKSIDLEEYPNGYHSFKIFNPGLNKNNATYTLKIESPEGFECATTNKVKISKPANLEMKLMQKPSISSISGIRHDPTKFYANLTIENSGESNSEKGSVEIRTNQILSISSGLKIDFETIPPRGKKTFSWLVSISPESSGLASLNWILNYKNEEKISKKIEFNIPSLDQHMRIKSIQRNFSNSLVTAVKMKPFSTFSGKWELPGKCLLAGDGGIEKYGYTVETKCYDNIVEVLISGNEAELPPLVGLFRVFHSGNHDKSWNRIENCININKTNECQTLEEIWE